MPRITAIIAVLTTFAILSAVGTANASGVPVKSEKFCAILLGHQTDPSVAPAVLEKSCSDRSQSAADAAILANSPRSAAGASCGCALLMTWFADAGYHGEHTDIYGDSGTCDSAGYSIWPPDYWAERLSSIKGSGQCNTVELTNSESVGATFLLPATFGATVFNDDVDHIQVFHH